jgi:homospermidine synthase
MNIIIFGNGAISKTFQMIHNFDLEIKNVDIDEKTKPDIVGNILDDDLKKRLLKSGDILVDLTNGQNNFLTADWCWKNNVCYINADIGILEENNHSNIDKLYKKFVNISNERKTGSTILFSQGMNPGLVSVYFKKLIKEFNIKPEDIQEVHISEIDTQISNKIVEAENSIIGTWCIEGLFEDGIGNSSLHMKDYWASKIKIKEHARENLYWTKNPWFGKFPTMLSGNHEETLEIGSTFNVPVCFSYQPPSQFTDRTKNLISLPKNINKVIMTYSNTISGNNVVGIYLLLKNGEEYWCGSNLSINDVRKLIKREIENPIINATSVLTAAGVIAGVEWIIKNKDKGYIMPLSMDEDFVIEKALPYIGEFKIGAF